MFLSEFPSWLGIVKCIGVRRSRWETRDSKRRKGKNLGKNLIPHLGKFEHLFIVRLFAGGPCGGQGNELARVGGGGFDPQPQSRSMEADASHRALPRQQSPHETPAQHLSAPEPQACVPFRLKPPTCFEFLASNIWYSSSRLSRNRLIRRETLLISNHLKVPICHLRLKFPTG